MRNPLYILAIVVGLMTTANGHLLAQNEGPQGLAFVIDGLTAGERDALARDLERNGGGRIAYACVPAGILVIEGTTGMIQEGDRAHIEEALHRRIGTKSARLDTRSREQLEAACMNLRDQ